MLCLQRLMLAQTAELCSGLYNIDRSSQPETACHSLKEKFLWSWWVTELFLFYKGHFWWKSINFRGCVANTEGLQWHITKSPGSVSYIVWFFFPSLLCAPDSWPLKVLIYYLHETKIQWILSGCDSSWLSQSWVLWPYANLTWRKFCAVYLDFTLKNFINSFKALLIKIGCVITFST